MPVSFEKQAFYLSFFNKFLPALGAGDGDLALSTGHANHLLTSGAGEITVIFVLDPVDQQKEPAVLLIPFVGIPAETAHQRPDQHHIGTKGQDQIHRYILHKQSNDAQHQTGGQNHHIQFIMSVPSNEESLHSHCQTGTELPKPCRKIVHRDHLAVRMGWFYYIQPKPDCNMLRSLFTECFQPDRLWIFLRFLKIL